MRAIALFVAVLVLAGLSFSINIGSCTNISYPGTYNLTANISGAPYSYFSGSYTTCIQINSSDVILDCGWHNITTTGTSAIEVEAPGVNVKITKCILYGGTSVDILGMQSGRIYNNSMYPAFAGIDALGLYDNVTSNDEIYNNVTGGSYGVFGPGSHALVGNNRFIGQANAGVSDFENANWITNNYISGCSGNGIYLEGTDTRLDGNTITGSTDSGVYMTGTNITFSSNTVTSNGIYGIQIGDTSGDYILNTGLISGNSVYGNSNTGIIVSGARFVNVTGNDVYSNPEGIHLQNLQGELLHPARFNIISGNTIHNNAGNGLDTDSVLLNNFTSNTVSYNAGNGLYLYNTSASLVSGNNAYNNTGYGFYLSSSNNNNVAGNTASGNYVGDTGIGFYLSYSGNNSLTGNTAFNNSAVNQSYGYYLYYSHSNNLTNNVAYNNYANLSADGFYTSYSSFNNVSSNTAYNMQCPSNHYAIGFAIGAQGSNNTVTGNTAYNNHATSGGWGFELDYLANNETISNNLAYNNDFAYTLDSSSGYGNIMRDNRGYNGTYGGMWISGDKNTRIINNTLGGMASEIRTDSNSANETISQNIICNSTNYGMNIMQSYNYSISNNVVCNTSGINIYFTSSGINFTGNNISGSTSAAFGLQDSNVSIANSHLFNNVVDLRMTGSSNANTVNATNLIIDRPAGDFLNYTNLSMNDTEAVGEQYIVKWAVDPTPLPNAHISFANKSINISTLSGSPSIDRIVITYLDTDLGPYNESRFALWKYNSTALWTNVSSAVMSPATNTITLSSFQPLSVYGIMQFSDTIPPSVSLNAPINGLNTSSTSITFNWTATDNFESSLLCNLTINGVVNVTNFPSANGSATTTTVSGFTNGTRPWNVTCVDNSGNSNTSATRTFTVDTIPPQVSIQSPQSISYASGTVPLNFTVSDNVGIGSCWYYLDLAGPNPLPGCLNTTLSGLAQGQHNVTVFANDTAGNTNRSTVLFVIGCPVITSAGTYTMNLNYVGAPNLASPFSGNSCVLIASSNVVFDCNGYNITNNLAGSTYGMLVNGTFTNVTIQNCPSVSNYTNGVYLLNSTGSVLRNITSFNCTGSDFTLSNANNAIIDRCMAYNSLEGFNVAGFNATLTSDTAYGCGNDGFVLFGGAGNHTLSNNTAYNAQYGFSLYAANNTLSNNTAYNSQIGFRIPGGPYDRNTLRNNTARNNSLYGFLVVTTLNALSNNTAVNNTEGFYVLGNSNSLSNNSASRNVDGYWVSAGSNNLLAGNAAFNNTVYGFYLNNNANSNNLTGNNASNNSQTGFRIDSSLYNILRNNTAFSNSNYGFQLDTMTNRTLLDGNNASSNRYPGFYLSSSFYNNLTNNTAYNNSVNQVGGGFRLTVSSYDVIAGNNATQNSWYGFYLEGVSSDNNITSNRAYNNSKGGFYLQTSHRNRLINNLATLHTAVSPSVGFIVRSSSVDNLLQNNTASSNAYGFIAESVSNNNLTANTAANNSAAGFLLNLSSNIRLSGNNATGNPTGFSLVDSSGNPILSNTANNGSYGYYLITSPSNTLTGNNASNCTTYGFSILNSNANNLTNSLAQYDLRGLYVGGSSSGIIAGNNITQCNADGMMVSSSNSNLIANNSETSCSDGLYLIASNNNAVTNNSFGNSFQHGILVLTASSGNNFTQNTVYSNPYNGFYLQDNSGSNNYINNTATGNVVAGFNVTNSNNSVFEYNNVWGNGAGFALYNSSGDNITANGIASNNVGILLDGAVSDSVYLNNMSNPLGEDIHLQQGSNGSTFYGNHMVSTGHNGAIHIDSNGGSFNTFDSNTIGTYYQYDISVSGDDNIFTNNTLFGGDEGITLNSDGNNVSDNSVSAANKGYVVFGRQFNRLIGNNATNASDAGFDLNGGNDNVLIGNNATDSNYGFHLYSGTDSNNLTGNSASNDSTGFYMDSADPGNLLMSNTAFNDTEAIVLVSSINQTLIGSQAYDSGMGIYVLGGGNNTIINSTVHGNTGVGVSVQFSPGNQFEGAHMYNDAIDFSAGSSAASAINLTGMVFDRPAGDFQNYTNISLNDTLLAESFTMTWSSEPATPPYRSFAGKFLNITNYTAVVIDNIAWHWNDAELVGPPLYAESEFQLFKYSGTWALVLGTTLNSSTNTLSKANFSPDGVYAILDEPVSPSHELPPVLPTLSVDLSSSCDGNTITVNSGGADISGADVLVDNADNLADVGSGTTDSDGKLGFTGCDLRVRIRVTKDGYQTLETTRNTIACEQCVECVTDNNCPDNKICSNEHCIGFSCSCGYPENHRCASYQCCKDSDCKANMTCVAHSCKVPEKIFECYTDKDCKDSQMCDIVAGDQGGKCKDITGCGEAKNHTLVAYECGTAPGCPSCGYGQTCVDTRCVTYGLKSPATGFVGDSAPVQATEDNKSCVGCDLRITDPTGNVLTGRTDSIGNFTLPLKTTGIYKVAYIMNGTVVKVVEIKALPKAPGTGEENPPTAAGSELAGAAFLVIALLALIVAVVILMRRGKGGKPKSSKEEKPQK